MADVLVLYGSHYGYTRTYAQWIAEDLGGITLPVAEASPEEVAAAETVVVGLSDYAGRLTGAGDVERLAPQLAGRLAGLFTVSFSGTAGDATAATLDAVLARNLPGVWDEQLPTGHFRGGMDYSRLSRAHRTAMMGVRTFLKAKSAKSATDRQMLECYGGAADYSDRESTRAFVEAVRARRG